MVVGADDELAGGMVVLVVALNSSMAVYAHSLFWVHMLVHLILIMVAPVLLVWAQPVRLVRDARRPIPGLCVTM